MPDIKIEGKIGGNAADAIEPHAKALYDRPGVRVVAVVELAHSERTQPAPDSEKNASVKLRISGLELPSKEQAETVREVMQALHFQRTAAGTLEEDGSITLTQPTLDMAVTMLSGQEVARLRAGLGHWERYASKAARDPNLSQTQLAKELRIVAQGLSSVLSRVPVDGD
ncbi:hypothetical protein [Spirillospora sp. CA-128828]|uniref:hypothetical protein n=1 Tax=Spirillospora sp. CA-128828 TaxID=3240033 RepID=UPI003D8E3977